MKSQVTSDIPDHGQFIDGDKLKLQKYLHQINEWTENHKMVIKEKKIKAMGLKGKDIEVVDKMEILGTISCHGMQTVNTSSKKLTLECSYSGEYKDLVLKCMKWSTCGYYFVGAY